MNDMIHAEPEEIRKGDGLEDGRLLRFAHLPSTNTWAMQNLNSLSHGDVITAAQQTAGRGRFDREWLAPAGSNLTVSVVLEVARSGELPAVMGQLAAFAVVDSLSECGVEAGIKWPNDVLVKGQKIAGILAEGDLQAGKLVVGLGLNVNLLADEVEQAGLAGIATSLLIETGKEFTLDPVLLGFKSSFESTIQLYRDDPTGALRKIWRHRDAFIEGCRLTVRTEAGALEGVYCGVDDSGRLMLRIGRDDPELLWSGEVEKVVLPESTQRS